MTEEQQERLKQIQTAQVERHKIFDCDVSLMKREMRADIDFLLSMIDSHADPRPYGNQHYPYCARHEGGNYNATLACTCYDYPLVAATAMRDACVVHLQTTADALDVRQETECPSGTAFTSEAALRRRIAGELQSLTLDQVEQEKHG